MKVMYKRFAITLCLLAVVAAIYAVIAFYNSPNSGPAAGVGDFLGKAVIGFLTALILASPFILALLYIAGRIGGVFRYVCACACFGYFAWGIVSLYSAYSGQHIGQFRLLSSWLIPASILVGIYLLMHEQNDA